ncbi:peptide/nickel transport system permease protein [Rhizobium azooxidifex]|uniref:Peptide/nickel transport system permease protein n=1 Tax=Mycoplana azooxidifex TaxID=1636188 RepID=A0A7W6DBC2_9HYPH|nr:ABC transporter permease [Mycoplana azooxidifex]MBB3977517.1 peptide/nickel transport system permease protein [Mycoplana azooxidifex]
MTLFLLRRTALAAVILLIVAILLFSMMHMIPGDPTVVALGPRSTPEMREAFREMMGLDRPVLEQLSMFLGRLAQGDLGQDVWSRRPVLTMILEVLPYTVTLALASFVWAVALGVLLGCVAVVHHGKWGDWLIGLVSIAFVAVPSFVVALYSLLVFAVWLNWLPAIGAGAPGDIAAQARALILPSFAVGLGWVGYVSRLVRAAMIEAMGEDYVRTLRAYGVAETRIVYRYALKQALLAILSVIAIGFGGLLTGSVFAEIVFTRPGLGKMTYDAVMSRNYPLVMGTVLVTSGLYVTCMILADAVTAWLDPRVRSAL